MPRNKFQSGHKINLGRVPWNKIPKPDPVYMQLPAREEVIWAAGFWEGEGSLTARGVNATQNDAWPLERLQRNFGGSIGPRKSNPDRPNQKQGWQWWICGESARLFIEMIRPYLSPRRNTQIDRVFITEDKRQRRRASIIIARRELTEHRQRSDNGQFNHAKIS